MPPAMGQPITVVEKPSSRPGIARFETNRSLTGMGHERYRSVDDILADRPVDELARRLFASGGVTEVHANGSVVIVHLADGWTGEKLLDVIRGLYIFYPPSVASDGPGPTGPRPVSVGPRSRSGRSRPTPTPRPRPSRSPRPTRPWRRPRPSTEPVDERVTLPDAPRSEAAPDASDS